MTYSKAADPQSGSRAAVHGLLLLYWKDKGTPETLWLAEMHHVVRFFHWQNSSPMLLNSKMVDIAKHTNIATSVSAT